VQDEPTGETSSPQDKRDGAAERGLFEGCASDKAKELYAESKRVRRQVERRLWWQANKPKEGEA
jgi:hypothetical protein